MRLERPVSYYTMALLPAVAQRAPEVTRLALIAESHRVLELPLGPEWTGPPVRKMHPNCVDDKMAPLDLFRISCALVGDTPPPPTT